MMFIRYFVLFCLAGVIQLAFLGLGGGTSVFSILSALVIIFISTKILGIHLINGRVIRLAIGFSLMHIFLGNIPIVVADQAVKLRPISDEFEGSKFSTLAGVFQGPFDHYAVFWLAQSLFFTLVFFGIFVILSFILRGFNRGIPC